MPALSFSVCREKILSGAKRQTIRGDRKFPIKKGDKLYLWWKQRISDREKLGNTTCLRITPITIERDRSTMPNIVFTDPDLLDGFAIKDGFDNWQQLIEFFDKSHGLPFTGNLIEWDYPFKS